jgi:CheY-like chemotaxis protein
MANPFLAFLPGTHTGSPVVTDWARSFKRNVRRCPDMPITEPSPTWLDQLLYPHLEPQRRASEPRRVLLIDDDRAALGTMRSVLEEAGHSVACATDGRSAVAAFWKVQPHIVVVEVVMPEQDGIETIKAIRRMWPEGLIIAISAEDDERSGALLRMARMLGAATLTKPFEPDDLLIYVRTCHA